MKGRKEEAEVIVRIDQHDQCAHINVSMWPAMYRKMTKLYGPSLDHRKGGNSARWTLPLKIVSFRRIITTPKARRMHVGGFKRREKPQSGDKVVRDGGIQQ
jgi:hypothetical protein